MAIENGCIVFRPADRTTSTATTRKTINLTPFSAIRYTIGSRNGLSSMTLLRRENGTLYSYIVSGKYESSTRSWTGDVSGYSGHYFLEFGTSNGNSADISKIEFLT